MQSSDYLCNLHSCVCSLDVPSMCCSMQSGTSLWASRRCACSSAASETMWFTRCCGRSWHSSLTNSNSQQPNFPGHSEQPQADPCDSDYAVSDRQVLFPSVISFLPMSPCDMTGASFFQSSVQREFVRPEHHNCAQSRFRKAVSSWRAKRKSH